MRSRVDTQAAIAVLEGSDRVRTAYPALAAGAAGFYMNVIPVHGESESGRSGPDVDTVFYVVAGRAQVVVEERSCPAAEGETLLVRPGERYRLSNAGDLELRALEIQMPVGWDPPAGHPDTCSDTGPTRRGEE